MCSLHYTSLSPHGHPCKVRVGEGEIRREKEEKRKGRRQREERAGRKEIKEGGKEREKKILAP